MPPTDTSELIELFLRGTTGSKGENFQTKFNSLLGRTTFLGSTSKPAYWIQFFRGSLETLPSSGLMKQLGLKKAGYQWGEKGVPKRGIPQQGILFYALTHDNKIIVKIFRVSESQTIPKPFKVSDEILVKIQQELELTPEQARQYPFEIQTLELPLKKEARTKLSKGMQFQLSECKTKRIDKTAAPHSDGWQKIDEGNGGEGLLEIVQGLTSGGDADDADKETQKQVPELFKALGHLYKSNEHESSNTEAEAAFHGFVHGALALNFKYRFGLDIFTEYYAGSGRIDLLLVAVNRRMISDNSGKDILPIVVEFKAGDGAQKALKQIQQQGYVSPHLNLRAKKPEQALIVGVDVTKSAENEQVQMGEERIYYPKGVLPAILRAAQKFNPGPPDIKNIQQELMHLYHSYGKEANTKFKMYIGHVIGNAMRNQKIDFKHLSFNQEKITGKPVRFLFRQGQSMPILLEIIPEQGDGQASNQDIPEEFKGKFGNAGESFVKVDIHIDKNGRPLEDIKIKHDNIRFEHDTYFKEIPNIEVGSLFHFSGEIKTKDSSGNFLKESEQYTTGTSDFLANSPLKTFVEFERDLQAVIAGVLTGPERVVLTESNASSDGRADIISVRDKKASIIELKMEGNPDEPMEQVARYAAQIKFLTGAEIEKSKEVVTLRSFIFKETGQLEIQHGNSPVVHTSDSELPSSQDTVDTLSQPSEIESQTPLRNRGETDRLPQRIPLSPQVNQSPIAGASGRQDQGTPGGGYEAGSDTDGTENASPHIRGTKRQNADQENMLGGSPLIERIRDTRRFCSPGGGKKPRQTRSVGLCPISQQDIEAIRANPADSPNHIKIDSDKFLSYLHSDGLESAKYEALIAFAGMQEKGGVVGSKQEKVQFLIHGQTVRGYIATIAEKAPRISARGADRLDSVLDLVEIGIHLARGEVMAAAKSANIIVLYAITANAGNSLAISGARLLALGQRFEGRALQIRGIFLKPTLTTLLLTPELLRQITVCMKEKKCTQAEWVALGQNASLLGVEVGTALTQVIATLQNAGRIAVRAGNVGAVISVGIVVGTAIYFAVEQVDSIDRIVKLKEHERLFEGLRGFVKLDPSEHIDNMRREKVGNTHCVQEALKFLKTHPDFKAYVLPTGSAKKRNCRMRETTEMGPFHVHGPEGGIVYDFPRKKTEEVCEETLEFEEDSSIFLNVTTILQPKRSNPDNPEGGNLFCLPGRRTEERSRSPRFAADVAVGNFFSRSRERTEDLWQNTPVVSINLCHNALGLSYSINRTGHHTVVNLNTGNDEVYGAQDEHYTFLVEEGNKAFYGGDHDDTFLLSGTKITGVLKGGKGTNLLSIKEFSLEKEKAYADLQAGTLHSGNASHALQIQDMSILVGRVNLADHVIAACETQYIDSQGGSALQQDTITLAHCPDTSSMTLKIHANTQIVNHRSTGYFSYNIRSGPFSIELNKTSQAQHIFYFNHTLSELTLLGERPSTIELNFGGDIDSVKGKITKIPNSLYHLNENAYIQILEKSMHISTRSLEVEPLKLKTVNHYLDVMDRFGIEASMTILHLDPATDTIQETSFIPTKNGENTFIYVPSQNLSHPSLVKLTIYSRNHTLNTLDLRALTKQLPMTSSVNAIDSRTVRIELSSPALGFTIEVQFKSINHSLRYTLCQIVLSRGPLIPKCGTQRSHCRLTSAPLVFPTGQEIWSIREQNIEAQGVIELPKNLYEYCFNKREHHLTVDAAQGIGTPHSLLLWDFFNSTHLRNISLKFQDQKIGACFLADTDQMNENNPLCQTSFESLPRDTANHHTRTDLHVEAAPHALELVRPSVDDTDSGWWSWVRPTAVIGGAVATVAAAAVTYLWRRPNRLASRPTEGEGIPLLRQLTKLTVRFGAGTRLLGHVVDAERNTTINHEESTADITKKKPNALNQDETSVEDAYDEEVEEEMLAEEPPTLEYSKSSSLGWIERFAQIFAPPAYVSRLDGSVPEGTQDSIQDALGDAATRSLSVVRYVLSGENSAAMRCVADALDQTPSRHYQRLREKGIKIALSTEDAVCWALNKFNLFVTEATNDLSSEEKSRIRTELESARQEIESSLARGFEWSGNLGLDDVLERCKGCFYQHVLPTHAEKETRPSAKQ